MLPACRIPAKSANAVRQLSTAHQLAASSLPLEKPDLHPVRFAQIGQACCSVGPARVVSHESVYVARHLCDHIFTSSGMVRIRCYRSFLVTACSDRTDCDCDGE